MLRTVLGKAGHTPEQLNELFERSPEFKADMDRLNAQPQTPQHHYGAYMGLLSQASGLKQAISSVVLVNNGADPRGVINALAVLNGDMPVVFEPEVSAVASN